MVKKLLAATLLFVGFICAAFAQDIVQTKPSPTDYFRYPLDLPPATTGSFAELRPNHFHSGLDQFIEELIQERIGSPATGRYLGQLRHISAFLL